MTTTTITTGDDASPTSITFEDGYRRLQAISERVSSDEVPVHEMCDLFAEGKGLSQALNAYLAEQKTRVEEIDRGNGVPLFRVVAPADPGDSVIAVPTPRPAPRDDDDIPF